MLTLSICMLVFCIEKLRCVFQYNFYCEDFIPSSLFFLDLLPETFLAVFIFYTLITMFDDKHSVFQFYRWLFNFLIIFLCLLVKICYFTPVINKLLFGFTWVNCFYTVFSKIFIVVLTILVLLVCLNKFQMGLTLSYLMEFPVIVGFSVLFLLLLTSSYDFFGVYLAIEGLSLTLYTLAGMLHFGVVSVEASIKYYSLGAISTGLFLFGVSLLFGLVGALDFLEVQLFLGGSIAMFAVMEIQLAILCILFGFFFKLSAFPCHIWVADVYEGVCSPITMFFAVVVKVSLLLCFIRIFYNGVSQSCVSNIKVSIDYVFSLYQCVITCVNKFRDWCSIVSSLKVFFDKW